MRDRIAAEAKRTKRSMNGVVVDLLEAYFPPEPSINEVMQNLDLAMGDAKRGHPQGLHRLHLALDAVRDFLKVRAGLPPTQEDGR